MRVNRNFHRLRRDQAGADSSERARLRRRLDNLDAQLSSGDDAERPLHEILRMEAERIRLHRRITDLERAQP